ncbi:hypothetical protein DSO57_1001200 [Entomophthora muscae]|uniref:Uncharacterized protein n=1 Tax=Entomophthora muscae TaxID=34485 RepID=A0ACC2TWV9_9FUNG|nr:hypothetical protein DSO57_1001200 [Entomophthora muscae]
MKTFSAFQLLLEKLLGNGSAAHHLQTTEEMVQTIVADKTLGEKIKANLALDSLMTTDLWNFVTPFHTLLS